MTEPKWKLDRRMATRKAYTAAVRCSVLPDELGSVPYDNASSEAVQRSHRAPESMRSDRETRGTGNLSHLARDG